MTITGTCMSTNRRNPPTQSSTAVELLERWRAGDPNARTELVEYLYPAIYREARARTRGTSIDAEDLTQEVFKLFLIRYEAIKMGPRQFLSGAMKHMVWARCRRNRRHRRYAHDSDDELDRIPNNDRSASSVLFIVRRSCALVRALGTLRDDRQREVALYYFQEKSQVDIATEQQCPSKTISTRLLRARQQLRREIERIEASCTPRSSPAQVKTPKTPLPSQLQRWADSIVARIKNGRRDCS